MGERLNEGMIHYVLYDLQVLALGAPQNWFCRETTHDMLVIFRPQSPIFEVKRLAAK